MLQALGLQSQVHFDHSGDGLAETTGWVGPADGLLVLDRDGDGLITSDTELFGDGAPLEDGTLSINGFQKLQEYDASGDGTINAADDIWAALKVWQDTNSDGITDAGELKTFSIDSSGQLRFLAEAYIAFRPDSSQKSVAAPSISMDAATPSNINARKRRASARATDYTASRQG